jgi:hypothetical protein
MQGTNHFENDFDNANAYPQPYFTRKAADIDNMTSSSSSSSSCDAIFLCVNAVCACE